MFEIKNSDLTYLFDQDHIRQGDATKKLKQLGKLEGLEKALSTSYKNGLKDTEEQKQKRIEAYGDNKPIVKPPKTLWQMILENFEDDMLKILCVASVVSLVLGIATEGIQQGWMQGASILIAVVIIVTVTSGNNWVKEKQFQKLNAIASQKNVNIMKNGDWLHMSVYDALVGDIQYVQTGEILSVDGVLIESHNLVVDQSAMTGETHGIKKVVPTQYTKENCFLVSGCKIMQGTGIMLICAVGKNSQYGRLKMKIQASNDATPLQEKLEVLANQVGQVGMYAAAATFVCMCGHIIYDCYASGHFFQNLFSFGILDHIVDAFIIAVSIIVVAVPQGLPLAVTIALAYSVGKMRQENNLVRYLQACQTMGGADNICSDKTGTLTKNVMTVVKFFAFDQIHTEFKPNSFTEEYRDILCKSICFNSNATPQIQKLADGKIHINQIGNKTQCALLQLAYHLGYFYKQIRNNEDTIKIYPFSSKLKSMTTLAKSNGELYTYTKGAPDFILDRCTKYINNTGNVVDITPAYRQNLKQKMELFSEQSLRNLLLAYRKGGDANLEVEQNSKDLIILGVVGIKDPLRQGIAQAVIKCNNAGVTVRMITGDNKQTAMAIAKQAGILDKNYKENHNSCAVMTGKQFREFVGGLVQSQSGQEEEKVQNIQKFKQVEKQLRVLARSSPQDKYLMATGLKQLGHVVAMTGDGTNDAPALKKADIGFAMGITGTQVAKQASGIILLDDNFNSIVTAMKWGRNIFDSIRKFLQFQLTVNMVALVLAFMGAAVLKQSPLNPIQMLWVNLIMDTMAALALATEPPSEQLLKRKPYSRNENLITPDMWRNVIAQGILQIIILGAILFCGPQIFGIQSSIGVDDWNEETGKHYSIFFNVFVLLQVFNQINARKLKSNELNVFNGFFNNPLFLFIMLLTLVVQYLCVEYGGQAVKTVPLTTDEHLICLGLGSLSIFAGFIFKLIIPGSLFAALSKVKDD